MIFKSKARTLLLFYTEETTKVVNGKEFTTPGEKIKFVNGSYVTDDKSKIAFIKNCRIYKAGQITGIDPVEQAKIVERNKLGEEVQNLLTDQEMSKQELEAIIAKYGKDKRSGKKAAVKVEDEVVKAGTTTIKKQ